MAKTAKKDEIQATITGTTTLGALVDKKLVGSISKVRMNENGYPYCTVLGTKKDANGRASSTNLYFGKGSAENLSEGQQFNVEEARALRVMSLDYSNGEKRIKLATDGESDYTDLSAGNNQDAVNVEKAIVAELSFATVDAR